jgi:hypothetical protein
MSHFKKINILRFMTYAFLWSFLTLPLMVGATDSADLFGGEDSGFQETIGLGNNNPAVVVASLINLVLGFLGIIMLVLLLLSGFKWMLSGGNEDRIKEARSGFFSAIIGMIIILSS